MKGGQVKYELFPSIFSLGEHREHQIKVLLSHWFYSGLCSTCVACSAESQLDILVLMLTYEKSSGR